MSRLTTILSAMIVLAGCDSGEDVVAPSKIALTIVASAQGATLASPDGPPKTAPATAAVPAERMDVRAAKVQRGVASWYGKRFQGRPTASGQRFDMKRLTAAHRTLPFGTRVRVTAADRSVEVCINDRGPFSGRRIIDLSKAAAQELGIIKAGLKRVEVAILERGDGKHCPR